MTAKSPVNPEIEKFAQKLRPDEHPYCLRLALEDFERGYISNILQLNDWRLPETAHMLGISIEALSDKIDYHGLQPPDFLQKGGNEK